MRALVHTDAAFIILPAMNSPFRRRRARAIDEQLTLPLSWLDEEAFCDALVARGVSVGRVRFKRNKSRLISLSSDHVSLNVHDCFRAAPGPVIDAVASFVRAPQHTAEYRRAIARMRAWWHAQATDDEDALRRATTATCCATLEQRSYLARLFRRLNHERFGGALPELVPIRLSNRMSRRFGHITYGRALGGSRTVEEIALNVDLMIEGNEQALVDTLVHEMAHAEAWLAHAHRGHGAIWRAIARRVGCEDRACSDLRIRRRRRRDTVVTRVPE
jgi:hypothetical protein